MNEKEVKQVSWIKKILALTIVFIACVIAFVGMHVASGSQVGNNFDASKSQSSTSIIDSSQDSINNVIVPQVVPQVQNQQDYLNYIDNYSNMVYDVADTDPSSIFFVFSPKGSGTDASVDASGTYTIDCITDASDETPPTLTYVLIPVEGGEDLQVELTYDASYIFTASTPAVKETISAGGTVAITMEAKPVVKDPTITVSPESVEVKKGSGTYDASYSVAPQDFTTEPSKYTCKWYEDKEKKTEISDISKKGISVKTNTTNNFIATVDNDTAVEGSYYFVLSAKEGETDVSANVCELKITQDAPEPTKINIPVPKTDLVYNGEEQIGVEESEPGDYTLDGTFKAILPSEDEGGYNVKAILADKTGTTWSDGTTDDKELTWNIAKKIVGLEWPESNEFTYDGKDQSYEPKIVHLIEGDKAELQYAEGSTTKAKAAGKYSVTVSDLDDAAKAKYSIDDKDKTAKSWSIKQLALELTWPKTNKLSYTGKEQTYQPTLSNLVSGDKVTLVYSEDSDIKATDVGKYTVTITDLDGDDKDNYSLKADDKKQKSWSIEKAENSITELTCADINQGETPAPSAKAKYGTPTFTYSTTEKGTYAAWDKTYTGQAGTYYVKASVAAGDNYSSAEKVTSFQVIAGKTSIKDAKITFNPPKSTVYSGAEIKVENIAVTLGKTKLIEDVDYEISYQDNVNAGTAKVIATAIGEKYTDSCQGTFTITAKGTGSITIDPVADQTYTGEPIVPQFTVKDKIADTEKIVEAFTDASDASSTEVTLEENKDYTVELKNNTDPGIATANFKFIGNYNGTKNTTFNIVLNLDSIGDGTGTGDAGEATSIGGDDQNTSSAFTADWNTVLLALLLTGACLAGTGVIIRRIFKKYRD